MSKPAAPPLSSSNPDTDYAPWQAYRRPYVRDLAFVLACPNVLTKWLDFSLDQNTHQIEVHNNEFWLAHFESYRERLQELDNTSAYQQLTRYLLSRPSSNRLGFHFEGLLSFWLEDGFARKLHPYETLANNVQLYNGKQTTGELDLILYNHEEELTEHWELAIKFFMGSAPFAPADWVGINSNDNLERKMTYMQNKQFRSIWVDTENHGPVKIDKRYGVIKGRFFLPLATTDFTYPTWLAPSFPMHEWCDYQNHTNLAQLDKTNLRLARYIEWFTKRDFYDGRQAQLPWLENELPRAGLYFENDRAIVIYPKISDLTDNKV